MNVPEKLINFRVYQDGADLLGVADVSLPSLEAMTETVKGAGVAGEVDSPVLGQGGRKADLLFRRILHIRILYERTVCVSSACLPFLRAEGFF